MTVAGASSTDGISDAESRIEVTDSSGKLPHPANLELADSVLNRLEPKDRHEMGQMIHSRSVMSGTLFAAVGIFWWLTVSVSGNKLGDTEPGLPTSMILNLGFFQVSLLIPLLVLVATVLLMHSRERSSWQSGTIGGILLIIALYFTLEPLGWIVFTDQGSPSMVLQSLRIGALAIMVHFATHMLLDAILLSWVQKMLQSFPLELSNLEDPLLLGPGDFDKNEEEVTPA
jgi:hypothetical protein